MVYHSDIFIWKIHTHRFLHVIVVWVWTTFLIFVLFPHNILVLSPLAFLVWWLFSRMLKLSRREYTLLSHINQVWCLVFIGLSSDLCIAFTILEWICWIFLLFLSLSLSSHISKTLNFFFSWLIRFSQTINVYTLEVPVV